MKLRQKLFTVSEKNSSATFELILTVFELPGCTNDRSSFYLDSLILGMFVYCVSLSAADTHKVSLLDLSEEMDISSVMKVWSFFLGKEVLKEEESFRGAGYWKLSSSLCLSVRLVLLLLLSPQVSLWQQARPWWRYGGLIKSDPQCRCHIFGHIMMEQQATVNQENVFTLKKCCWWHE